MKIIATLVSMLSAPLSRGSGRALLRLGVTFITAVVVFSAGFLALMAGVEGRQFSWLTAVYWTLVTMTTLGFGDIVFESDVGRLYSVLVLLTGSLLILILLPFTFIQLVYLPWRAAVRAARIPRALDDDMHGHVILTGRSPMEELVLRRARALGMATVVVVEDADEAAALHDEGHSVLFGALDDPATYEAARATEAAMVLAVRSDQANTNIAFTVRDVAPDCLLVVTANSRDAFDVLELAGADRVLHLGDLLGAAFAERILEPTAQCRAVARFDDLVIGQVKTAGTDLVGRTIADLALGDEPHEARVVGVWERGALLPARPEALIDDRSILLLAGSPAQLAAYERTFGAAATPRRADADQHVVVLGGGRVGRAVARALDGAGTRCVIVDRQPERVREFPDAVVGDAADREVLRLAGIDRATAVVVTTHDDDTNIYLTLYCRRLRPEAEILGRVGVDRNLTTLHRAGADVALSYASVGAIEAWGAVQRHPTRLLAERLVAFRTPVPAALVGRPALDPEIGDTGCVLAGVLQDRRCIALVDERTALPAGADLVLVGDPEAEERFQARFVTGTQAVPWWRRLAGARGGTRTPTPEGTST